MRLVRKKEISRLKDGECIVIKKISLPEFLLHAKREVSELFAEAVTSKDHEKFADILEVLNSTCDLLQMDWYECSKIKSTKRWEEGKYDCYVAKKVGLGDREA
tara:strand:+ start:63 stop:371 length:309 start_codon:yes stop_codon:yes gene_type:complete